MPHNSRIQLHRLGFLQRAEVGEAAKVVKVDLAVILALGPAPQRMRASIKEQTVRVAPQLRDRVQVESNDFINIFLLRKVAVHAVRDDTFWQALTLHAQLLFVDIPSGL